MSFRWSLALIFVLLNLLPYLALRSAVDAWVRPEDRRRKVLGAIALAVFLLNVPLGVFLIRPVDVALYQVPSTVLRLLFYPSLVWLTTIITFFVVVGPPALVWGTLKAAASLVRRAKAVTKGQQSRPAAGAPAISRRSFLAGGAGLLVPGIYGVAAYGVYGSLDEVEISDERSIPIPHLPRSLEGMTIVQLSDLHVGPYIREQELRRTVGLVNQLRPDLVVITGDMIDRHLSSLPEAVRGLKGIRSSVGAFTVLGNHDIYSDPYSSDRQFRGGVNIARGLEEVGIRTLRNEVVYLGSGQDRLALLGLEWLSPPESRQFYSYQPGETRRQLRRMAQQLPPETPSVLLAHHPDTFSDAIPFGIGLTLAGHTHGGGQVLLGYWGGVPIGIGLMRFQYLSGLYQENGCSLYVNRGLGYLGIPIRINCPPEISRFRLIRPASA